MFICILADANSFTTTFFCSLTFQLDRYFYVILTFYDECVVNYYMFLVIFMGEKILFQCVDSLNLKLLLGNKKSSSAFAIFSG